jgi:hypothetical protein
MMRTPACTSAPRLTALRALLLAPLLSACSPDDVSGIGLGSLTLHPTSVSAAPAQSVTFALRVVTDRKPASAVRATWRSVDPTVFRIDTVTSPATVAGEHRAIGRAGRAGVTTFTVTTDDGQAFTVPVTVAAPAAALAVAR